MSHLTDLLLKVKEQNLTKEQAQEYYDDMVNLHSMMELEISELEKKSALFMDRFPDEISGVERERKWKVTPEGQREIELKHFLRIATKQIKSLYSRNFRLL